MQEKYKIEYTLKSSPKVLFTRLSTPWGLAEWFADDVRQEDDTFIFVWNNTEQEATIVNKKPNSYIRFHWLDDEDEETYFEFKISVDELTRDVALEITDFAEPEDKEDAIELWNSQIEELKLLIGS
jgi:uncharacterized protein YndB with AHSA1/START domain